MNKLIIFVFVNLMISGAAWAASPSGDNVTEASPPKDRGCNCDARADNNVPLGDGSEETFRDLGKARQTLLKEANAPELDKSPTTN